MDKFDLIDLLEGKLVPIPSGEYKLVKDGKLVTDFGKFSLLWYEIGQLETMLKYAKETIMINSEILALPNNLNMVDWRTGEVIAEAATIHKIADPDLFEVHGRETAFLFTADMFSHYDQDASNLYFTNILDRTPLVIA